MTFSPSCERQGCMKKFDKLKLINLVQTNENLLIENFTYLLLDINKPFFNGQQHVPFFFNEALKVKSHFSWSYLPCLKAESHSWSHLPCHHLDKQKGPFKDH